MPLHHKRVRSCVILCSRSTAGNFLEAAAFGSTTNSRRGPGLICASFKHKPFQHITVCLADHCTQRVINVRGILPFLGGIALLRQEMITINLNLTLYQLTYPRNNIFSIPFWKPLKPKLHVSGFELQQAGRYTDRYTSIALLHTNFTFKVTG